MVLIFGIHCAVGYLASDDLGRHSSFQTITAFGIFGKGGPKQDKANDIQLLRQRDTHCRTFTRCENDRLDCQAQVVWENHLG